MRSGMGRMQRQYLYSEESAQIVLDYLARGDERRRTAYVARQRPERVEYCPEMGRRCVMRDLDDCDACRRRAMVSTGIVSSSAADLEAIGAGR